MIYQRNQSKNFDGNCKHIENDCFCLYRIKDGYREINQDSSDEDSEESVKTGEQETNN